MFYAHFVLSKKGPLARIWLAAHWDKKLTKAHVFETNIDSSVEAIIQPKVKMALRTSGHLLLGVVRIYSRKAKYLLADCNEAFVKIKMAFRPGVVDLPEENREAAVATITLPETFHDFDTTMADLNDIDVQAQFSVNQSRPEEITMREDLGNITLVGDDGFGDMGFDDRNLIHDAHMDDPLYKNPESSDILLDNAQTNELEGAKPMDMDFDAPPKDDEFGPGPLDDFEGPAGADDDDDDDNDDSFGGGVDTELFGDPTFMHDAGNLFEEPPTMPDPPPLEGGDTAEAGPHSNQPPPDTAQVPEAHGDHGPEDTTNIPEQTTVVPDQTTLVPNEAEAFALEPLDVTSLGTERKAKRKRKLIVDEQKGIPSETMKLQLSDTSEICTTLDLAPPTKKLMHWKETGGVEKLFALPGRSMPSKQLSKFFNKNLITRPLRDDEIRELEDRLDLPEDHHMVEPPPPPPPVPRVEPPPPDAEVPRARDSSVLEAQDLSRVEQTSISADLSHSRIRDTSHMSDRLSHQPPTADTSRVVPEEPSLPVPAEPEQMPEEEEEPYIPPMTPGMSEPSPDVEDADDIFNQDLPDTPGPPSVGGQSSEGDEPEEGTEDYEERRWNKRTQQMLHILERQLQRHDKVSFKDLCDRNNRKQVASKFYTFLVLKKQQAIQVEQTEPFGDILVTRGPNFEVAV